VNRNNGLFLLFSRLPHNLRFTTPELISGGADVAANAQKIVDLAGQVPMLFEANEITGDSTALPAIWENYDDFTAKAGNLQAAAQAVVDAANGGGDVASAAKAMGGTCGACHKSYKGS